MNNIIYGLVDPRTHQLRYIGKSQRGMARPKQHSMPTYLKEDRTHKANWIRQLLAENLKPEIVILQAFEDTDILAQAEIHWIAYFKAMGCPLTNQCRGGEGFTGHHTDEAKEKIRASSTGRKQSAETKALKSAAKIGKPLSEAHKQALHKPHKALSAETRQKMSDSRKGKPMNPACAAARVEANKLQRKPIIDSLGRIYEGQGAAARQLGLSQPNILAVLKGRAKATGGLSFKYL